MSSDYFYGGANYGFDSEYGTESKIYSQNFATNLGLTTDPRVANKLKAVSEKLNTGAKIVEIEGLSAEVFDSIPKEHFKELNRLRKIVGDNVELTLHGPIVEPTGLRREGQWEESDREQSERQMISAVERAHELNPKGNVVTTFHSSAVGLPSEVKAWEGEGEKRKEVTKEVYIFDEKTGKISRISMKPSAFEGNKTVNAEEEIKKQNKEIWYRTLQHLSYSADVGASNVLSNVEEIEPKLKGKLKDGILGLYSEYVNGNSEKVNKAIELLEPEARMQVKKLIPQMVYGDINLRDAYNSLREMFDQAYSALENSNTEKAKEDLQKLDEYRKKIAPKLNYLKKTENVQDFAEEIKRGVHLLSSIETPQIFKPFKEFALNKSSETFANVAFKSYKEFGESSPIISIENPPAGQFAASSGEDLKELVKEARRKFAEKASKELGMPEEQAKREAEKLIGATWDLGHINMIRKFGGGEADVIEETKKIAPFVKHLHLSDNFGMEHTELPMGMGNVPTKEATKIIEEYNKKIKKIIEAGSWYHHFKTTPFQESMQALGSPLYATSAPSYFSQGGYFSGYGFNPEYHHQLYGSGFSNLPVELGGQMSGRSRVSGNPME